MTPRPPLEVADIFRQFGEQYLQRRSVSSLGRRVLAAIQVCRTAALGGHLLKCDECGHSENSYNSCRNRHCPKCQAAARAQWFEAREKDLLPVPYFHLIFTLPEAIRPIALQNKKTVYGILFRAAAETLRQVASDPKQLGAQIGFFGVLHTWGQTMVHHPHVHFVIPGGGFSADRTRWIGAGKRFFLPLNVLRVVFRGKFLDFLERAFKRGELSFAGSLANLADAGAFKRLLQQAARPKWAVQAKPPFAGPRAVLKYLARYTHRVAISNARLISLVDGKVTFRYKDYSDHDRPKTMTLDAFEFMRRFLLHVLPKGFMRIRHYGFLAGRNKKQSLELARALLSSEERPAPADPAPEGELHDHRRCPVCKKGRLFRVDTLEPIPFVDTS